MAWLTSDPQADRHYFLLAVVLYGVSTVYSVFLWRKGFRRDNRINYFLLLVAFACHTTAMLRRGFDLQHCPVNNLYEATLFIAWTIVAAYLVLGIWPRLRFLGAFASPVLLVMGVFALMRALDPPHGPQPVFDMKFHKLRAILSLLPPIQRLEKVATGLVAAGFALLTAGLALFPLLPKKAGAAPEFDPIVLWSAFVWLLYLVLLVLHWRGQGGRRFAWAALGSFAFILRTFWGIMLLSRWREAQ